jgi:hypothetical protein
MRRRLNQRIVLDSDALLIPDSTWSDRQVTIPYAEISHLAEVTYHGYRSLLITHRLGDSRINEMFLPRKEDFEQICHELVVRTQCRFSEARC